MHKTQWRLQDAKTRFSQVVEAALQGEPQHVTRHGRGAVVAHLLAAPKEDAGVVRWISAQQENGLYLSVITLGEVERGIEKRRKSDPAFANDLAAWLESLTHFYADRILAITPGIARRWGRLSVQLGHDGADVLIAATALTYGLTVVSRNVNHFEPNGVAVLNPFSG